MRSSAPTITTFRFYATMQDLEGRRRETTDKLDHYLEVMGYE
jgi:hypothetical protein